MDDTKRFISRQNVSLIQRMIGTTFQDARNKVVSWLQNHKGYVASLSEANESLIREAKNQNLQMRPISNLKVSKQDESENISDRLKKMQEERSMMTDRRPTQPNLRDTNSLVSNESREDILKQTSSRLEEMQRLRSFQIPVPKPEQQSVTDYKPSQEVSVSTLGNSKLSVVFHSQHAERKQAQEWWERIWNMPEIHTMAIADRLYIPYLVIETKRRSSLRRILVKVDGSGSGSGSWILTPSQTKLDQVFEFKVVEEIWNEDSNLWTYHFEPIYHDGWKWGSKTDRISVSLIPINIGYFWNDDEVASWSIITRWIRGRGEV